VHTLRYIGLVFLAPAATGAALPQTFAVPAGLGTAIAGVLALASIALLRARSRLAIPLIWVFSVEGIADFANAFVQARSAGVVTQLGAAYYVPIVVVPAALVTRDDPRATAAPLSLTICRRTVVVARAGQSA